MIINDLDGYYIVFDTKNWNTELDTLENKLQGAVFNSRIWLYRLMNAITAARERDESVWITIL